MATKENTAAINIKQFRAQQRRRPKVLDLDDNEYVLAPLRTVPDGGVNEGVVYAWVLLPDADGEVPQPRAPDGVYLHAESAPADGAWATVIDVFVPRRRRVGTVRLALDVAWWPRFARATRRSNP